MNKHSYHIDTLKAYLAGKLDGKSMHEIEKRALEDPFLADALEGLSRDAKTSLEGLKDLQQLLHDRTQVASGIPGSTQMRKNTHRNWWLAVAAVLLAGLGSLYIFKLQTPTDNKGNIAQEIAQGAVNPSPSAIAPKTLVPGQDSMELARSDNNREGPLSHNIAKSGEEQNKIEAPASILFPQKKRPATAAHSQNKVRNPQGEISQETALIAIAAQDITGDGKATGDSNNTAMGATAYVKMDAITEAGPLPGNGAVRPPVPALRKSVVSIRPVADSVKAAIPATQIVSNQVAKQRQNPAIASPLQGQVAGLDVSRDKNAFNDVNEVVVVGYGRQTKRNITGAAAIKYQADNIHPVGGREAFDSYIADQVQTLHAQGKLSLQDTGTVVVQFTIARSGHGKPEKIKILKGAGRKLNKMAKTLLLQGADWQSDTDRLPAFTGAYTVTFK